MKKLVFLLFLASLYGYSQGGPKVDVIKFRGEVTTSVRNTFDVPTGETWLIWNVTTTQLEIAGSDDVWSGVSDDLGNHTATMDLNLDGNQIINSGGILDQSAGGNSIGVYASDKQFGSVEAEGITIVNKSSPTYKSYRFLGVNDYLELKWEATAGGKTFGTTHYTFKESAATGADTDVLTQGNAAAADIIDASGFDGNLDTGDNTLQELAQALDDLVAGGGGLSSSDIDTFAELDAIVADESLVNTNDSQALTNKTIDATANTISNIDETDLDTSVNASLDLADSSIQPGDIDTYAELNALVADKTILNEDNTVLLTNKSISGATNTITAVNGYNVIYDNGSSGLSATNAQAAIDEVAASAGGVAGTIAGRTGTTVDAIMIQTAAQLASDGAPASDEVVFCSDCAPAETFTGTAIPLDGYYTIDNTSTDTATWTLGTEKNGGLAEILINLASEPAVTGATQIPGTADFSSNTLSVLTVKVIQGSSYYFFTALE